MNLMIVLLLLSVTQFAMTIYSPAMPEMVTDLDTTKAAVQLSVSVYYLSLGLSQFVYGPLSDAYGRKKIILSGVVIYLLGSALAAFSQNMDLLLVARFVQGAGIGCGLAVGRSVLGDVYKGSALRIISNIVNIFVVIIPIISPIIGAYLQYYAGWQSSFSFLFYLGLLAFVTVLFFYRETNTQISGSIAFDRLKNNYRQVAGDRNFWRYCLPGAAVASLIALITVLWPFMMIYLLGLTPIQFAYSLIFAISFYIFGSMLNLLLGKYLSDNALYTLGYFFMVSACVICVLLYRAHLPISLFVVLLPVAVALTGAGIIFPNTMADALAINHGHSGIASAIFSGLQMLSSAFVSALVSAMSLKSSIPIIALLFLITAVSVLSFVLLGYGKTVSES